MALVLERQVECGRGAEAEPRRAEARHAFLLESLDDGVERSHPRIGAMLGDPELTVKAWVSKVDDGVAVKDVGHDGLEAVPRKIVCQKLRRCEYGRMDAVEAAMHARRTLLLTKGIPKTSVRKRTTLSLG